MDGHPVSGVLGAPLFYDWAPCHCGAEGLQPQAVSLVLLDSRCLGSIQQRTWRAHRLSNGRDHKYRRISTVSNATISRKNFYVCYFYLWHAREGLPGCTRVIESNHGSKNERTNFPRRGVNKGWNHNCGCKILLTYDPWISTPQYPEGHGSGMGDGIRNGVGTLNFAQA